MFRIYRNLSRFPTSRSTQLIFSLPHPKLFCTSSKTPTSPPPNEDPKRKNKGGEEEFTGSKEERELIKKKYENEMSRKLNRIVRNEVFPMLMLTACGLVAYFVFYKNWDYVTHLASFEHVSDSELRFAARKVATYVKYSNYSKKYEEDRIEHELVEEAFTQILKFLQIKGLKTDICVYRSAEIEVNMLPNGAFLISDRALKVIDDPRQLVFLILRHLELLLQDSLKQNISQKTKYRDFRRQLFYFKNKYTGFDVLFIDYLTNMRYTLNQIQKADLAAVETMKELGISLKSFDEKYTELMVAFAQDKDSKAKSTIEPSLLTRLNEFDLFEESTSSPSAKMKNTEAFEKLKLAMEPSKQKYEKMLEEENKEKEAVKKQNYQIYDKVNYKLNERKYHVSELNPVSKETLEKVTGKITQLEGEKTPLTTFDFDQISQVFEEYKGEKRKLRKVY